MNEGGTGGTGCDWDYQSYSTSDLRGTTCCCSCTSASIQLCQLLFWSSDEPGASNNQSKHYANSMSLLPLHRALARRTRLGKHAAQSQGASGGNAARSLMYLNKREVHFVHWFIVWGPARQISLQIMKFLEIFGWKCCKDWQWERAENTPNFEFSKARKLGKNINSSAVCQFNTVFRFFEN